MLPFYAPRLVFRGYKMGSLARIGLMRCLQYEICSSLEREICSNSWKKYHIKQEVSIPLGTFLLKLTTAPSEEPSEEFLLRLFW